MAGLEKRNEYCINHNKKIITLTTFCFSYLYAPCGDVRPQCRPVLPFLVLLCTFDEPALLQSPSHSDRALHFSFSEVGTCNLDGLFYAEPGAALLHPQMVSFHSQRADYGKHSQINYGLRLSNK